MGVFAVTALLDLVFANLWRSAALALLVLVGIQWVQEARLSARLAHAESALTLATDTAELAGDMRAAAEESTANWKALAGTLEQRLRALVEETRVQREHDAAQVAAARAAEVEANTMLAAWMDRYAQATREPSCRALMETPLCVAVD
jgi:hypothetical protein